MAVTMVLSRLLTPRDIGIVAIGTAIVSVAHVLRDFGVSAYLIQEKELTHERLRSTFGVTIVTSWTIAAALAASSGLAAALYREPGVHAVILVLSLNFVILPFGAMVSVLMQRDMDFAGVYKINVICGVIYGVTVLSLAALGVGFISIAWASVVNNIATVAMAYRARPSHMRLRPSFVEWRRVVRFGVVSASASLIGTIGVQAPDLIIGRVLGLVETGLFSKAQGLVTIFNENVIAAITPVATSKFAATHRAGEDLKQELLGFMCHVTAIAWPFFAFSGPMMFYVMRVLFGDQWDAAILPAQILCIAAFIAAPANLNWAMFQATGRVGANLRVQATVQGARVALVIIGCPWGLTGIATAMVLLSLILITVSFAQTRRHIGFSLGDIVAATRTSLALAVLSAIPAGVTLLTFGNSDAHILPILAVASLATLAAWSAGLFLLRHPLHKELTSALHRALEKLPDWRPWPRSSKP
jgi:O-antigen/teichoic acid export membrane protein